MPLLPKQAWAFIQPVLLMGCGTASLARAGGVSIWDCPWILIPDWC